MDEDLKKALLKFTTQFLRRNYDYLWLKTMLEKGCATTILGSTLVTGSSYALAGIQEDHWKNVVNCSMHSQDFYYDFQCACRAISSTEKCCFERCFIITGYYTAFQDISRSEKLWKTYASRIHYPIFHDAHHWENPVRVDPWASFGNVPEQVKALCETIAANEILRRGTYYSDFNLRHCWVDIKTGEDWGQASEQERQALGADMAEKFNRHVRYKASFEENKRIFQEYIRFLHSRNVTPILVIPPFSEEILRCLLKELKEGMLELVDSVPEEVHYVDFNEAPGLFQPEDFIDQHHLNAGGAEKMSSILVDMFGE